VVLWVFEAEVFFEAGELEVALYSDDDLLDEV